MGKYSLLLHWLFYQQYHVANACSQRRSQPIFFCDDRIVWVAGKGWAVCIDSGGSLLFLYSITWSRKEQIQGRSIFGFIMVYKQLTFQGT